MSTIGTNELQKLAHENSDLYHIPGPGKWLECWFDIQLDESIKQIIEGTFHPYRPFHYGVPDSRLPIPIPTFLGPGGNHLFHSSALDRNEFDIVLRNYNIKRDQKLDKKVLIALKPERDAITELFNRVLDQIRDVNENAMSVIKPWLIEVLGRLSESDYPKACRFARRLWTIFVSGNPINWPFDSQLLHTHLWHDDAKLDLLSRNQREGMLYYGNIRDHVLKPALKVNARRYAIELIILKALLKESLPSLKQIDNELIVGKKYHDRIMALGRALRSHIKENDGHGFSSKGEFKKWAMEIDKSGSPDTIRNLLERANLYISGKRGRISVDELSQTLQNILDYLDLYKNLKNEST